MSAGLGSLWISKQAVLCRASKTTLNSMGIKILDSKRCMCCNCQIMSRAIQYATGMRYEGKCFGTAIFQVSKVMGAAVSQPCWRPFKFSNIAI